MIRAVRWLAVIILIFFILIKGKAVFMVINEYRQADKAYDNTRLFAGIKNENANDADNVNSSLANANPKFDSDKISDLQYDSTSNFDEFNCPINPDFDSLKKINKDTIGWIYLPDTKLNYPIVKGTDNEYYLTHMFDGKSNSSGSIFADCNSNSDFDTYNTVIYGHHMKNGSMFAVLSKYKSKAWYDEHPILWLVTPEKVLKLRVYSVYTANVSQNAWKMGFDGQREYKEWLTETKNLSEISTNIYPDENNPIITLSTCSYEFDNARLVVHATID